MNPKAQWFHFHVNFQLLIIFFSHRPFLTNHTKRFQRFLISLSLSFLPQVEEDGKKNKTKIKEQGVHKVCI
jgi:hypothetical protein